MSGAIDMFSSTAIGACELVSHTKDSEGTSNGCSVDFNCGERVREERGTRREGGRLRE